MGREILLPSNALNMAYMLLLGASAACGGLMFGFDVAIITGAGPFLTERFALTPLQLGEAFSALLFGCALGALSSGRLSDAVGSRLVMIAVAVLFAITSIATGLAPSFDFFVVARFIGGLAVGAVSLAAPMYVSEISPARIRGRMGALYQMSIAIGILVSYTINYALKGFGPESWRYMFLSGVIPSVLFFGLMLLAPETPVFLVRSGRSAQALRLLRRIGGQSDPETALTDIQQSLDEDRGSLAVLLSPEILKPLSLSFCLAILIHVSGINTIIDYAPSILKSAGFNLDAALLSTFVIGVANFSFTIVSFWTIDRFGRKPLYIVGSLGMAAALIGLVFMVQTDHFEGPIVLAMLVVYMIFFCSCIGPVFWTLIPEIFPNSVRARAMTVPVLTQWIANAAVVLVFPLGFQQLGKTATFGILAVACAAQALFAWLLTPETRNRSLEDIARFWRPSEPRTLKTMAPGAAS